MHSTEPCLFSGLVWHKRFQPFGHAYQYRVFTLWAALDDLPALAKKTKLFGYNKFNLFSLYDRDHGARDGTNPTIWLRTQAQNLDVDLTNCRLYFLGFPRILGYVFNPLSVFIAYAPDNSIKAIFYQVKNTFGQQHIYMVQDLVCMADKVFHVSPFFPLNHQYHFTLKPPRPDGFSIAIRQTEQETDTHVFSATWTGDNAKAVTNTSLLKMFWQHPFMPHKVIAAIHWQALLLWLKGAKFHKSPPLPKQKISN